MISYKWYILGNRSELDTLMAYLIRKMNNTLRFRLELRSKIRGHQMQFLREHNEKLPENSQ